VSSTALFDFMPVEENLKKYVLIKPPLFFLRKSIKLKLKHHEN